ncbi:carboxymuconolactone decarboxylase family protein [Mariluticola halotolerans]|uniref:carboxymuconolactone decarboxylase family protein n=1 Tax=Mariluticola halotolerans TaxID=2909283 RepID=UPI0026E45440|nr:carboxymuconolactone decarboxylase family protein [Mariluticola halotolerans]UJQ94177.1 carboxymuconolactone decarboxylase family protein [Mariluticola halotolerans]
MTGDAMHKTNGAHRGVRISLPGPDELTDAQRRVYEDMIAGPRGAVVGPIRAAIHSPEMADRWQKLGEFVRYHTVFPEKLSELAIIASARRWNSEVEFCIHRGIAEKAGISADILDALRDGVRPEFTDETMREVYDFTQELQMSGTVSDKTYLAIKRRWDEQGVVELTGIVGYYTMVAMMLNTHHVPLPAGTSPQLGYGENGQPDSLTELPSS